MSKEIKKVNNKHYINTKGDLWEEFSIKTLEIVKGKAILSSELDDKIRYCFVREYEEIEDIFDKCCHIYLTFDNFITPIKRMRFLRNLLVRFASSKHHLNELKTVLTISKRFKEDIFLKDERLTLLSKYNKLKR